MPLSMGRRWRFIGLLVSLAVGGIPQPAQAQVSQLLDALTKGYMAYHGAAAPATSSTNDVETLFKKLEGAEVVAQDGTYLGKITRYCIDPLAFCNRIGEHGSAIGIHSIFNKLSPYGSNLGPYSPFNPLSATPPLIIMGDQAIGYLTVETNLTPRLDPRLILAWAAQRRN